jgi:hypothetical protein
MKVRLGLFSMAPVNSLTLLCFRWPVQGVRLIDVVDPTEEGKMFADFIVKSISSDFASIDYDALLITRVDNHETVLNDIKRVGVPSQDTFFLG